MNKIENKYKVKEENKYVIATIGTPTLYLKKTPAKNEYCFVEDVSVATKSVSFKVAEQIMKYYYIDTKTDIDLVTVPLRITYELIEE